MKVQVTPDLIFNFFVATYWTVNCPGSLSLRILDPVLEWVAISYIGSIFKPEDLMIYIAGGLCYLSHQEANSYC